MIPQAEMRSKITTKTVHLQENPPRFIISPWGAALPAMGWEC